MKNVQKLNKRIISILTAAIIIFSMTAIFSSAVSAGEISSVIDSTLSYAYNAAGTSSAEEFVNSYCAKNPNSDAEWYVLAMSRYKYRNLDYSQYISAVEALDAVSLGSSKPLKCSIALTAVGDSGNFVKQTCNNCLNTAGYMSYVFGLILLTEGNYSSSQYSREELVSMILNSKARKSDGGWAIGSTSVSDPDVTAMTITALSAYCSNAIVKNAVDKALTFLSSAQLSDGGYISWGNENCESCAQVIVALCSLNIDPTTDSRFIKNGNSVYSAMLSYKKSDNSFSHVKGGNTNGSATSESLYAAVALWRLKNGYTPLFRVSSGLTPLSSSFGKTDVTTASSGNTSKSTKKNTNAGTENTVAESTTKESTTSKSNSQTVVTENTVVLAPDELENLTSKEINTKAFYSLLIIIPLGIASAALQRKKYN